MNNIIKNKIYDYINYVYDKNYDNKIHLQCVTSKVKTTINLRLFDAEDFVQYLSSERGVLYFVNLFNTTETLGLDEELAQYFYTYITKVQKIYTITTEFTQEEIEEKWESDIVDHVIDRDNQLTVIIDDNFETFNDIKMLFTNHSINIRKKLSDEDLTEYLITI